MGWLTKRLSTRRTEGRLGQPHLSPCAAEPISIALDEGLTPPFVRAVQVFERIGRSP